MDGCQKLWNRKSGLGKVKKMSAITTRVFSAAVAIIGATDPSCPAVAGTISQDEITVYKTVLASWFDGKPERQLVDYHLDARPSARDPELLKCTKGLRFAGDTRPDQDQKSLVGGDFKGSAIDLIDGSKWNPNDPGRAIAKGKSIGTALGDGIAHSLISFSQIAFSYDDRDALVKISVVCGSLCGIGSTIHLHKSGTQWKFVNHCGGWVS
jgi:hypothetical protein